MWNGRESLPHNGTIVEVEAVWGTEPDDGKISFEGEASFKPFKVGSLTCPLTGEIFGVVGKECRWVRGDTGYVVPGRIVRWKYKA